MIYDLLRWKEGSYSKISEAINFDSVVPVMLFRHHSTGRDVCFSLHRLVFKVTIRTSQLELNEQRLALKMGNTVSNGAGYSQMWYQMR